MDEVYIQQVEIVEPEWTPLESAMWLAGLVPTQSISREEMLELYPDGTDACADQS
jgi:hypothetical protein